MIQNILIIGYAALLVYLIVNCYRIQKAIKRADKLIKKMEKEINERGGEDEAADREK